MLATLVAAAACNPTSPVVHHGQSEIPGPRTDAASAFDIANRTIVMLGGANRSGVLDETWTWDGRVWQRHQPASLPPAREFAFMGFDPGTSRVVLFGGTTCAPPQVPDPTGCEYQQQQTNLSDTWAWDGRSWSPINTQHSPSIKDFRGDVGGIAADPRRGELILVTYGVWGAGNVVETWALRNGDWVRLHPEHSPPASEFSGPTYDAVRGHLIIQQQGIANTTWTWDGSDWSYLPLSVKTPHSYGQLVSVGPRGLLLIDGNVAYRWNGTTWAAPDILPASVFGSVRGRFGWTAAYHEPSHELILFGGRIGPGGPDLLGDTVGWDGSAWKTLVRAQPTPLGALGQCSPQQSVSGLGGGPVPDPSGAVVEVDFSEPPSGPCHLHVAVVMTVYLGNNLVEMTGNPKTQEVDVDLEPGGGGVAAVFDAHGVCALGAGGYAQLQAGDFHTQWDLTGYTGCNRPYPSASLSITSSVRVTR